MDDVAEPKTLIRAKAIGWAQTLVRKKSRMLRKLKQLGTTILIAIELVWPAGVAADPGAMTVYKTASYGCC